MQALLVCNKPHNAATSHADQVTSYCKFKHKCKDSGCRLNYPAQKNERFKIVVKATSNADCVPLLMVGRHREYSCPGLAPRRTHANTTTCMVRTCPATVHGMICETVQQPSLSSQVIISSTYHHIVGTLASINGARKFQVLEQSTGTM